MKAWSSFNFLLCILINHILAFYFIWINWHNMGKSLQQSYWSCQNNFKWFWHSNFLPLSWIQQNRYLDLKLNWNEVNNFDRFVSHHSCILHKTDIIKIAWKSFLSMFYLSFYFFTMFVDFIGALPFRWF